MEKKFNVVISPAIQNRDFFWQWASTLPFYRNVAREGKRFDAA